MIIKTHPSSYDGYSLQNFINKGKSALQLKQNTICTGITALIDKDHKTTLLTEYDMYIQLSI